MVSTDSTGKSRFPPGSCCYHCPALSPPFASSLSHASVLSYTVDLSRADTLLPSLTPCKVSLFFSRCGPPLFCAPMRFQMRPTLNVLPTCPQRALNVPSQGTSIQLGLTAKIHTMYFPPSPLSLTICSCVVLERNMTCLIMRRPSPHCAHLAFRPARRLGTTHRHSRPSVHRHCHTPLLHVNGTRLC